MMELLNWIKDNPGVAAGIAIIGSMLVAAFGDEIRAIVRAFRDKV